MNAVEGAPGTLWLDPLTRGVYYRTSYNDRSYGPRFILVDGFDQTNLDRLRPTWPDISDRFIPAARTVSTPAEFDALPDGSVITWGGRVYQKQFHSGNSWWYGIAHHWPMPVDALLRDSDDQQWAVIGGSHA